MRITAFVLTAICFIFIQNSSVKACTCINQPLEEYKNMSDAIFTGKVLRKASKDRTVFKVEKYWKGELSKEVFLYTAVGGSCEVNFTIGKRYVVFSYASKNGELNTNICMQSGPVKNSGNYLSSLGKGKIPKSK